MAEHKVDSASPAQLGADQHRFVPAGARFCLGGERLEDDMQRLLGHARMAIRFFVGCKDAPTEGAVQSEKLKLRTVWVSKTSSALWVSSAWQFPVSLQQEDGDVLVDCTQIRLAAQLRHRFQQSQHRDRGLV